MESQELLIYSGAVEPFFKNGYILACPGTREGIYIDPGDEVSQLLDLIDRNGIQIQSIVNTHAHLDHISGIGAAKRRWDVPIYLHPDDRFLYENLQDQALRFGLNYPPAPPFDRELLEETEVRVGELALKVHHTPGHSPGGVCLEVRNHIFCGDVIFAGSIGRTDLPGGSYERLIHSIVTKVLPLGDDKILHPGHGPETTIGQERRTNPFLTGLAE